MDLYHTLRRIFAGISPILEQWKLEISHLFRYNNSKVRIYFIYVRIITKNICHERT